MQSFSILSLVLVPLAILGLIGVGWWAIRRFGRFGGNSQRGRIPRIAKIEEADVDSQRRLVLVRRDNVEHLLLVGGKSDIVVELNIVRSSGRDQLPQRSGAPEPPRLAPMPEVGGWADEIPQPESLDLPEPQIPERPTRPAFMDEVRRPASPAPADRRSDPLAGLNAGHSSPRPQRESRPESAPPRLPREPLMPRPARHSEPLPVRHSEPPKAPPLRAERAAATPLPPTPPAPPPLPPTSPSGPEQNIADMAQRLEAALRRPNNDEAALRRASNETVPSPTAAEPSAPGVRPPRGDTHTPAADAAAKGSFEFLEDEMASLLGRTKPSS